jgi:hypothetical protein
MEAAEFMDPVKTWKHHTLPSDCEQISMAMAGVCAARASHAELRLYNDEEALKVDLSADKLKQLAQVAALGSHAYVLEDGPELPKVSGPHAEEGGEILTGCMHKAA